MLETLRTLSLQWYSTLSQIEAQMAEPVRAVAFQWNIPAVTALLFGLLGTLAPCQLTANVGAVAYLSNRAGAQEGSLWRDTTAFLWGRVSVYTILGTLAILLGLQLPTWAMAAVRKAFGPAMVVLGFHMLGLIRLRFSTGQNLVAALEDRLPGKGSAGAFLLGAAYSLAFCPTMALLFFGLLVPLGVQAPAGIVLPAIFAVGTALPLLVFAGLVSLGLGVSRDWLRRVRNVHRYIEKAAGAVFVLAGLNDTFLYWFL